MKKLTLLLLALLYVTLTYAYTERDLLQKQADINRLKEILVLDRQWVTYPDYNDRAGWDRFLGTFKDEYIRRGEKRLNYQWQVVKATDYLAFERTGNRQIMEKPFGANNGAIADLLMAELAEGKGRFVDQLINGVQCLRNDIMGTGRTYHRATFPQSITRIRLSCHRPYFR